MNSINKFCIMGRLTKDPTLKILADGTKVANVIIAVDRDYRDKEKNKITDFLHYALWDKNAENICNISKKGSLVYFEGYNVAKEIETKDGKISVIQPIVETYKNIVNTKTQEFENESNKNVEINMDENI